MFAEQDDVFVEAERIQSVFQQVPLTLLVTVVNAFLTAVVLAPVASHRLLWLWGGLITAVSSARWAVRRRFLRRGPDGTRYRPWAALSVVGSLATGILWGTGATILSPTAEMYQLFFAFVVGGMCAGATAVNSAHLPTVLAFILPATLALAASFLAEGSAPRFISGLMILVFALALSLTSWRAAPSVNAFGFSSRLVGGNVRCVTRMSGCVGRWRNGRRPKQPCTRRKRWKQSAI